MSETTQVRGLNRNLLERARQRHEGMTNGSLINLGLRMLLNEDSAESPIGIRVIPPRNPSLDIDGIAPAHLPGVSLEQTVLAARQ